MEPHEVDEILRELVRIAAHQDVINTDLREFNRQQLEINARLETLVTRMFQDEENGREG